MTRRTRTDEAAAPFAAATREYVSAIERRDLDAALEAANEAVRLEPERADPYLRRAAVWRLRGDDVRAANDRARCRELDPRFEEREADAAAVSNILRGYTEDHIADAAWTAGACRDAGLAAVLAARAREVARRRALLARPSCDLPCPSACCYFEDETYAYSICLNARELEAVRAFLAASGLDEDEFLSNVLADTLPETLANARALAEPDKNGVELVHFLKRSQAHLPETDAWGPRTRAGRELAWVTGRARACMFVGPAGCAIHDVGTPPGLAGCRSFVCLTALVFLVLRDLGVWRSEDLTGWRMPELRDFAYVALPLLGRLFGSEDVRAAEEDARRALHAAVDADRSGDADGVARSLSGYDTAIRAAGHARHEALKVLRDESRTFMARSPS
jgi:hypothetical protein